MPAPIAKTRRRNARFRRLYCGPEVTNAAAARWGDAGVVIPNLEPS